jgi:hypothetical protein
VDAGTSMDEMDEYENTEEITKAEETLKKKKN